MFSHYLKNTFFWGILTSLVQLNSAQFNLRINEWMGSNVLTREDEFGEYDDWIEIYNAGSEAVDLSGYYLSDDQTNLTKWKIPQGHSGETTISSDSHLLLWADGQTEQGVLHLGFRLSKKSGWITITLPDSITILDSLTYVTQFPDVSYGRYPDGSNKFMYFLNPTPESTNIQGFIEIINSPTILESPGFYSGSIPVTIQPDNPADEIHYTLDGSDPDTTSLLYTAPVSIHETTVLKARAWRNSTRSSFTSSQIYFIGTFHSLPTLTVITDPKNLFDQKTGIYVNYDKEGRQWERKVENLYFQNNHLKYTLSSGIRIQGTSSVIMPKKSFRLFFREGYGYDRLEYPMFGSSPISSFKSLVLRAGYDEDITTPQGTLLRDPLITELWRRTGYLTSHSKFAVLYLNNNFWGIYDIRESINEHFVKDHVHVEDLDLIRHRWGGWELKYGDSGDWKTLLSFIQNNNFESDAIYSEVTKLIDIENFTTLQAFYHATQFRSWTYNAFAFKEKRPDAKWRWTIWDMDRAYTELNWNGFYYYDNQGQEYWINFIVRKLLQNLTYRNYFINRLSDLLNTLFLPEHIIPILDSLATSIASEIPLEVSRWNSSVEKWENNVENLRQFIKVRPSIVRQQMMEYFDLEDTVQLTVNVPEGGGVIQINTIEVNQFPWNGIYFKQIPVQIVAIPSKGYQFISWSDSGLSISDTVTLNLTNDYSLTATFEPLQNLNTEVITPPRVRPDGMLPLVSRIKDSDGNLDPLVNSVLTIQSLPAGIDTSFNIKKGAGAVVISIKTSSNTTLTIQGAGIGERKKMIKVVPDYPGVTYSGVLPSGKLSWNAEADIIITGDLTIPEDTRLVVEEGTWILLGKYVNIFVEGELIVKGSKEKPVVFTSENWAESWGGIEFYSTNASLQYCFFLNGGGDPTKGWAHTNRQPILFSKENSELSLNNCFILNSPGKALGSIESKVNVSESITSFVFHGGEFHYTLLNYHNSHIMNIPSDDGIYVRDEDNDGFHIDYVYPHSTEYSTIDNCYFITGKDDAVDHHESRVKVTNCWIEDWIHEGLAASGGDTIKIFNTVVKNCEQGIEAGNGSPNVSVDHCVVINNEVGVRFGDEYSAPSTGHITVTNSILYNNKNNIWNYVNSTQAPYEGAIDISFSMTNDEEYDTCTHCISGIPNFDENYYLLPSSPGVGMGIHGTNLGLLDSLALVISPIVINEIMYNPSQDFNSEDWIELYNPQSVPQDISHWILKDEDDVHVFQLPFGIIIQPQDYLVICRDKSAFTLYHPGINNFTGDLDFGFGEGDEVRLFSPIKELVDSVAYSTLAPWPTLPDGHGYSLELMDVIKDNSIALSWDASYNKGGTPGRKNSMVEDISELPQLLSLEQNYPNPFNSITTFSYTLREKSYVTITIYNLLGQQVRILVNEIQSANFYRMTWNSRNKTGHTVASGLYVYQVAAQSLETNQLSTKSRKMILLK